jgi:hypothetical protein
VGIAHQAVAATMIMADLGIDAVIHRQQKNRAARLSRPSYLTVRSYSEPCVLHRYFNTLA